MSDKHPACVLAVAGSDSSAGAGIQADLKTCAALGGYAATAITAVTAQNTRGVDALELVSPTLVKAQMLSVLEDLPVGAIKVGMLGSDVIIDAVAEVLCRYPTIPVVLDPVLVSSSGRALLNPQGVERLLQELMPRVTLVTPNLPELELLSGSSAIEEAPLPAMQFLLDAGAKAVLLKGGHRQGGSCQDLLVLADGKQCQFEHPRLSVVNNHGTGCTLSSAIATFIAQGYGLPEAVSRAKEYLTQSLATADRYRLGQGHGPLNHFGWK